MRSALSPARRPDDDDDDDRGAVGRVPWTDVGEWRGEGVEINVHRERRKKNQFSDAGLAIPHN